jgi:hypothetical protein
MVGKVSKRSFLTAWTRSPSMTQEFAQADVSVRVRSVTRLDIPSRIYIIEVMIEIDLEPEVEAWLTASC